MRFKNTICLIVLILLSCQPGKKAIDENIPNESIKKSEDASVSKGPSPVTKDKGVDFGQESQNGDWTFAQRGREVIREAKNHLTLDILWLDFEQFKQVTQGIWLNDGFQSKSQLMEEFEEFLNTIYVPENEELFEMLLTGKYLIENNGKRIVQLDYFLNYGSRVGEIERIFRILSTKKIFLQEFALSKGVVKEKISEFLLKMEDLSIYKIPSDQFKLRPITSDQATAEQLVKFLNTIFTFQVYNQADRIRSEKELQLEKFSIEFDQNRYGDEKYSVHCINSETIPCENGMDFVAALREYNLKFYSNDKNIYSENIRIDLTIEIQTNGSHSYFLLYYQNASKNLALNDLRIKNGAVIENINIEENYKIASDFFNFVKFELITELKLIDTSFFSVLASRLYYTPENYEKILSEIDILDVFSKMENLTYENFKKSKVKIKNFDFDSKLQTLHISPAFYFNYGKIESELHKAILIEDVKKMLLHEFAHLYGLNEEKSKEFSNEIMMFHLSLVSSLSTDQRMVKVNAAQWNETKLYEKWGMQEKEIVEKHLAAMKEELVFNNVDIVSIEAEKKIDSNFNVKLCYLVVESVNCNKRYDYIDDRVVYKVVLKTKEGKKLHYELPIIRIFALKSAIKQHGALLANLFFFSFDEKGQSYLNIMDENEKVFMKVDMSFESPESSARYTKIFGFNEASKIYVMQSF